MIDQFVLRGGRALVFLDPFSEEEIGQGGGGGRSSNPIPLLDAWGVELVEGKIAGDIQAATRVTVANGLQPQAVDYVAWLGLKIANFNKEDFIAGGLDQINMATAGILKKKEGATTEVSPLIQTSEKAMPLEASAFQMGPNPLALLNAYQPGTEKLMLAVRISGAIKTAFSHGPPEKMEAGKTPLTESKGPINVIVVADADMLSDRFWVDVRNFFGQRVAIPRANNATFLVNALDHLSGSSDLISLRSRGEFSRPFEKVKDIQREAERQFLDKEKALSGKLKDTERKLSELQSQKQASNAMLLTNEQKQELEKFRAEQVRTRKELRNVQHELRKNIELLGTQLKFINIGLIPLFVVLMAVGLGIYRYRRLAATTLEPRNIKG